VVALPPELKELLGEVVRAMRRGQAVTLAPLSQQLTTQEAADLLGISRPRLIKLLEEGGSRTRRLAGTAGYGSSTY
jgi:excisionase family DNA binding protein